MYIERMSRKVSGAPKNGMIDHNTYMSCVWCALCAYLFVCAMLVLCAQSSFLHVPWFIWWAQWALLLLRPPPNAAHMCVHACTRNYLQITARAAAVNISRRVGLIMQTCRACVRIQYAYCCACGTTYYVCCTNRATN